MNEFEHIEASVQDAILMGLRYKEAYEKLLWEKGVLISCLCSGRTDVIGLNKQVLGEDGKRKQATTYHVRVKELDSDEEAVWGLVLTWGNGVSLQCMPCPGAVQRPATNKLQRLVDRYE